MRSKLWSVAVILVPLLMPVATQGVTLALEPSAQSIGVGETATIELVVADLGVGVAPSLGAFFVEVLFDPSILSFDSVVYGELLGSTDPFDGETDIVTTVAVGNIGLDEISFLFDFELDPLQPDSFILATLTFTGSVAGSSDVTFGDVDLSDGVGSTLTPTALDAARVDVSADQTLPEPGTVFLLLIAVAGVGAWARGRQASQSAGPRIIAHS